MLGVLKLFDLLRCVHHFEEASYYVQVAAAGNIKNGGENTLRGWSMKSLGLLTQSFLVGGASISSSLLLHYYCY